MSMQPKKPTCHPDRPHVAKGLCGPCYSRAHHEKHRAERLKRMATRAEAIRAGLRTVKPATCHPDRPHVARGLCGPCYSRQRREPTYQADGFTAPALRTVWEGKALAPGTTTVARKSAAASYFGRGRK